MASTLCPCFFALVEAVTYNMRRLLLARYEEGQANLTEQEYLILRSKRLELSKGGGVKERDVFYQTLPHIKFTLKCFAKYVGKEEMLSRATETQAWGEFRKVQQARHGITHPKEAFDLILDDEFMRIVKSAGEWFLATVTNLIEVDFAKPDADET